MPSEPIVPVADTARSLPIDVLRGLSILAVVLLHIQIRIPFQKTELGAMLPRGVTRVLFGNGFYGVKVFFVISGFLITTNILRRWGALQRVDIGAFYRLRFARIAPCLVALLAILSVLHTARVEGFVINPQRATLAQALFAAATFHLNVLEIRVGYLPASWDVLWSLSIEEAFYLGYPLLCRFLPDKRLLAIVGAALILAGPFARTVWAGENELAADKAYLAGFDCIAMGCAAAWASRNYSLGGRTRQILWWVGASLMVQITVYPIVPVQFWRSGTDVTVLGLGTALLLVGAAGGASGSNARNPLAWLGRQSYEIYLTHGFVMILVTQAFVAFGSQFRFALFWYAGMLAVSAWIGWVVARYYSEPLNRRLRGATR